MSRICVGCGNYLTEGADCPDCAMNTALVRAAELEAIHTDDHAQILSLQAACDRYRAALEQIRDGLANTPNPDCSPFVTEAIDALYHYACNALKG